MLQIPHPIRTKFIKRQKKYIFHWTRNVLEKKTATRQPKKQPANQKSKLPTQTSNPQTQKSYPPTKTATRQPKKLPANQKATRQLKNLPANQKATHKPKKEPANQKSNRPTKKVSRQPK